MWEFFNKISSFGITPNECFFMLGMLESITPNSLNKDELCDSLFDKKMICLNDNKYKLTTEGELVIKKLNALYTKKNKIKDEELMGKDFKSNVEKYRLMFPAKKLPSGKLARNNINTLIENFRWFFASHNHTWEDVFKATKNYIKEYRNKDWQYMKTSQYFISKQDKHKIKISELADYCDLIKEGLDNDEFIFDEKVV